MLKIKIAVLTTFVLTALLCFTSCSLLRVRVENNTDFDENDISMAQDELENIQEPDTRIFLGEEYVKRENIAIPKYVLKNTPTGPVKKQEYKLVTPTQEEFDEIAERLNPILSMFIFDYDCEKDNIYEFLFVNDRFYYGYPEYDEEVAEYIAKPLAVNFENGFLFWDVVGICEDDPLSKFPISDVAYDENGNLDLDKAYAYCSDGITYKRSAVIGHNMFSGAYVDWLVEGVWNGQVNHDTYMQFDNQNPTQIYYYDGNYYTPDYPLDRGGGIMCTPYIHEITPLGDNKYKMIYYKNDGDSYGEEPVYNQWYETVIGLKETQDGFRFWSIFSIDYDLSEDEYRIVSPTEQELEQMPEKLDTIFGTHFGDYECTKDNAYENSFGSNHLHSVAPDYDEIPEYVAAPIDYHETDTISVPEWHRFVPQNDPLGKFPKIHESVYDENGNVDKDRAFELLDQYAWNEIVIGFNQYSAPYIDWLVEGVWNGRIEHEELMEFDDSTRLYYYDGFYYAPEYVGDYGGDGYDYPIIDDTVPAEEGKYEVFYHFEDYDGTNTYCKAVIGMKETSEGFRFWSIFSIDYDIK